MEAISDVLNRRTSATKRYCSMAELVVDFQYPVKKFVSVTTKFGRAVKCTLQEENGEVEVFLPKSMQLTDKQISNFENDTTSKTLIFLYKGRIGRAFDVDFKVI